MSASSSFTGAFLHDAQRSFCDGVVGRHQHRILHSARTPIQWLRRAAQVHTSAELLPPPQQGRKRNAVSGPTVHRA